MARNKISLEQIVNNYMLESTETDINKDARRSQLVSMGKRLIRNQIAPQLGGYVSSVIIDVNQTLYTVALPNDFLDWTKVGVVSGNEVHVIGVNDKINVAGEFLLDNSGDKLLDNDGIELKGEKTFDNTSISISSGKGIYFFHNFMGEGGFGTLYGIGGGNNRRGEFRFNSEDNRIELNKDFQYDQIVLEYVADGSMPDNVTVPFQVEQMMHDWFSWQTISRKSNASSVQIREAKRNFRESKRMANFQMKMFSPQELVKVINKRYQQAPKFLFEI